MNDTMKAQLFTLLRSFLKVVGAGMVTEGYMDQSVETWLAGGVAVVLGVIWSAWTHKDA